MKRKNKNMRRHFTAVFSAVFLFISTFADCFHSHHLEGSTADKASCAMGTQVAEIIAASEEQEDCDGDCPACSYLLSAQGVYFDSICLPEKQASVRHSVAEQNSFHNYFCFENPARAPPYSIV